MNRGASQGRTQGTPPQGTPATPMTRAANYPSHPPPSCASRWARPRPPRPRLSERPERPERPRGGSSGQRERAAAAAAVRGLRRDACSVRVHGREVDRHRGPPVGCCTYRATARTYRATACRERTGCHLPRGGQCVRVWLVCGSVPVHRARAGAGSTGRGSRVAGTTIQRKGGYGSHRCPLVSALSPRRTSAESSHHARAPPTSPHDGAGVTAGRSTAAPPAAAASARELPPALSLRGRRARQPKRRAAQGCRPLSYRSAG